MDLGQIYWLVLGLVLGGMLGMAYGFGKASLRRQVAGEIPGLNKRELRSTSARVRTGWWAAWLQGVSTEMVGAVVTTVLLGTVVGAVQQQQLIAQQKQELILQMGSPANAFAVEAARLLRVRGWGFADDDTLQGANLVRANLQGAELEGVNLQGADLEEVNLQGANLDGANLQRANLYSANLQEASLAEANLQGARLSGSNLQEAHLVRANLRGVIMRGYGNLQGADLEEADLERAELTQVDIRGANLAGANLLEASLMFRFDGETILPDGLSCGSPGAFCNDVNRFTTPHHPAFWRSDDPDSPAYWGEED
jgi:hypothetical protein